jgi:hypothetical protein
VERNGTTGAAERYAAALEQFSQSLRPPWQIVDWSGDSIEWRLFRHGDAPLPQQGWKIHISAAAVEAGCLLSTVAAILVSAEASFKIARSLDDIVHINSGDAGATMVGKVITVYPLDDDHAARIAQAADRVWPSSRGPEVQTDLHLRPGSAVSLRYGLFRSGPTVVGSSGIHEFALALADGRLVSDTQRVTGRQCDRAPDPPLPCCPPRPLPVRLNETFTIDGRQYVPLALLRDSPRTKIFLAFSARLMNTVVMKVAVPGVAGDLRGLDIRDKLRKEFQILSSLRECDGLAPRPIEWVEGEWAISILHDFRGDMLSELPRRERIESLAPLARAVTRLHQAGFVHGDIKLENAVRTGTEVGLIDFELAERAGDAMGGGGTPGYMAPEVKPGCVADFSRDAFALGVSVAEAVLGIPPALLPEGVGRLRGLMSLEGAATAARLTARLTLPAPALRPAVDDVDFADLQPVPVEEGPSSTAELQWCRRAAADAGRLVERYADGECWRNEHFMRSFHCEGLNIGAAGIILGLATIDQALGRRDFDAAIDRGARWLAERPAEGNPAGLFTGNAGVALALAVAGRRLGKEEYLCAGRRRMAGALTDERETDIFSGVAGVAFARCLLGEFPTPPSRLNPAGEPYLGCAHGAAGIAMALARCGQTAAARNTFHSLYASGRTADNRALRITRDSPRAHAAGNWCHGVAGYLWAILQGLDDDPDLREEIDWAVGVVCNSPAAATPTYCHGLAGRLELWRMLAAIPRYREMAIAQAGKTVRALRLLHHKLDGRIAWCSDDPQITTPDLWIGFLGPATALALHAANVDAALLSQTWLSSL